MLKRVGRAAPASQSDATVLVIDDDPAMLALVRITLRAQGWQVIEARTLDDGVALAGSRHPDAILLDVVVPGDRRDGFAACRELRANPATRALPIVLFTAHDDAENRAFASAVGATAFIAKPFGPIDLVAILRQVVGRGAEPGIGLFLVDTGVLTPTQLDQAVAEQRLRQGPTTPRLGQVILDLGFASEEDLRVALERQRRMREKPAATAALADIRVVVADDHPSVRDALHSAISEEQGLSVVGLAIDGDDALRLVRTLTPDVLVLDNDMPKRKGLDVLRAITQEAPSTRVVVFTMDETVRDVARAAGAAAVITKDQPLATLIAEVKRAAAAPSRAASNAGVVFAVRATRGASVILARQRRRITVLGILGVAYAAAFLLFEPLLGASSSVIGLAPVAVAGALFGPETGVIAAALSAVLTALLWQGTGHEFGEPIFTVGGNGVGALALVGVGAGFGVMRAMRGRIDARGRTAASIAEAAAALLAADSSELLALLAQAAVESVRSEAALLYLTIPGGGIELVAATGPSSAHVGSRARAEAITRVIASGRAAVVSADRAMLGIEIKGMRSAVVAPLIAESGAATGAIVVMTSTARAFTPADVEAVTMYARFAARAIGVRTVGAVAGADATARADAGPERRAASPRPGS